MSLARWFLTQVDTYGPIPVLASEAFTLLTTWCAIGSAWTAIERIRASHNQRTKTQPNTSRKETP